VLRAPFRTLDGPFDRALVVRRDPLRDCVVPLLDALAFVRLAPFAAAVRVVLAVLVRAVRAFGACARPFPEPELAELVRDADFDAAELRERLAVFVRPPSRDRFVVAMSSSRLMNFVTRESCDLYPWRGGSNPVLVRQRFGVEAGFDS
jgi:hypothetical protein